MQPLFGSWVSTNDSSNLLSTKAYEINVLSGNIFSGDENMKTLEIVSPFDNKKTKSVKIFIIDNSGSMQTLAAAHSESGEQIPVPGNLDLLGVGKHAVRTAINAASEDDYIGIIKYSTNANIVLPLTKMTDEGKVKANEANDLIRIEGSTNFVDAFEKLSEMMLNLPEEIVSNIKEYTFGNFIYFIMLREK